MFFHNFKESLHFSNILIWITFSAGPPDGSGIDLFNDISLCVKQIHALSLLLEFHCLQHNHVPQSMTFQPDFMHNVLNALKIPW